LRLLLILWNMMRYYFYDDLWALKYVLWNRELRYVLWLLRRVKDFIICFMNNEGEMLFNDA
jgi:hypothetical protein